MKQDIGFALDLLRANYLDIPILGVCLGHQAIGVAFGGKVNHILAPLAYN
jgi:anthranilate/para-aminobenzoate synthase component II